MGDGGARDAEGPRVERICVLHSRLGALLAAELAWRCPDADVTVLGSADEPPHPESVDVLVANTIPPGLLGRCRRLRWLQLTSSGVDQLAGEALPPGLLVTHAGTIPARAVAEFAWMGVLALAKDAIALWRQQSARQWCLPQARLVAGSTLVLVGLGNVGAEIARRARPFEVRVLAVTRRGRPSPLADEVVTSQRLARIAGRADHLVLAVPATPQTRGMVSAEVVGALRPDASIVNVARGSVLDTDAVVEALRGRRLRGALLDVLDDEPLPAGSRLWDVEGLWITPHTAFLYPGEAADLAALIAANLTLLRTGQPLRNQADLSSLSQF
jgi:phosphoglycerate dehydrogenase-like enzyme